MKSEEYYHEILNMNLICQKMLGEKNNYNTDKLQEGEYYDAMEKIIRELEKENKINCLKADRFLNEYKALKGITYSEFINKEVFLQEIAIKFEDIIGFDSMRNEQGGFD